MFILGIDPLIRNINSNPLIKGVDIDRYHLKVLAYADDVALIASNTVSIDETFKEYERLFECSGLELNSDKTECLWVDNNPDNSENQIVSEYLGSKVTLKGIRSRSAATF